MVNFGYHSGFLTAICETRKRIRRGVIWLCLCECGNTAEVDRGLLRTKRKKSCGCKTKAQVSGTHGMYNSRTHSSWRSMLSRCRDVNHTDYEFYSKLGFCQSWLTFEQFYLDMGDRPEGCSLDRVDNSKGYSKENCRWATLVQQQHNRSPNYINKCKGLAGVFKSGSRFCARVTYKGIKYYLGTFDTPEEANAEYNKAGLELVGDDWVHKGSPVESSMTKEVQ